MKQYTLLSDHAGIKSGTILSGPLPIMGQSGLGYYTPENLPGAPSTQAIFASAVENNPSIFKETTQQQQNIPAK